MNVPLDAGIASYVLTAVDDGVATVTLNRGERYNPLSREMLAALEGAIDAIAKDDAIRVVVLAGAGRGFCAGHDLKELRANPDLQWQRELFGACGRVMAKLTEIPQPVIARVHGIATAAGCLLVSMCDLAIAAAEAKFALPGVNVGVFCSTPAVGVARNIGRKRTMEMLLSGDAIDAATALQWGLVNRVVDAAQLDAEIARWAAMIQSKSARLVAVGKEMFYRQVDRGLEDALAMTAEAMACNLLDPDAAEGIDAFVGKRKPTWVSRDRG